MNHTYPHIPSSPGKDYALETCENCGQVSKRYRNGRRLYLDPFGRWVFLRPSPCSRREMKRKALAAMIDELVDFWERKNNTKK